MPRTASSQWMRRYPGAVLAGQAQDGSLDGATGRWSAGPLAVGGFGVTTAYGVTVPPQDRVRGDDQVQLPQLGPGEMVEKRCQKCAVCRRDAWPVDLSLQGVQLVAQRQYLDVFVRIAQRQHSHGGRALWVPINHPAWSRGMLILVEGSAESVSSGTPKCLICADWLIGRGSGRSGAAWRRARCGRWPL
jgi:hypothetical protein